MGKIFFFWEDIWLGEVPMKVLYPDLYQMCSQPQARVIDHWDGIDWNIAFRRSLSISEKQDLDDLILLLNQIDLVDGNDNVLWDLEKSKVFSTKSLYSFITNMGVTLQNSGSFWKIRVPLKVKIFLWQVNNDKLQNATTLKHRGWRGSHLCCLCQKQETADHIFF